jgi:hypothetical protein
MGILDANQDSTDTALRVMASRPLEPEQPVAKHSAWTAIPRALAAGATEIGGNILDVAGAYGQVSAAMGQNANPFMAETHDVRKQRLDEYDRLKADGINWRTEEGQAAYSFARDLRPDPMTAGAAENLVFGLTKGLSKAVGAGMMFGPVGGAAVFGTSEGMTTSEDLSVQGVDQTTRTKAGAVVGAVNAVGMALPVAGKTLAQTAALVAGGGPASFVVQQQAVRSILENADYGKIAQQYDPLDPAGLALSFLLPAGFATWAKSGAIKAAMQPKPKAGKPAAEPTITEPAPMPHEAGPTQEQIDAAMVHNLTIARDAHESANPVETQSVGAAGSDANITEIVGAGETAISLPDVSLSELRIASARDFDAVMAQIRETKRRVDEAAASGQSISDYLAKTEGVPPEVNNLLIGIEDAAGNQASIDSLVSQYADAVKLRGSKSFMDVSADVVEAARTNPPAEYPRQPVKGDPNIVSMLNRVDSLAEKSPDMPVAVRDDGTYARLADEMEALRREAREGTDTELGADDAPLLQVAVECALSMGAAA